MLINVKILLSFDKLIFKKDVNFAILDKKTQTN